MITHDFLRHQFRLRMQATVSIAYGQWHGTVPRVPLEFLPCDFQGNLIRKDDRMDDSPEFGFSKPTTTTKTGTNVAALLQAPEQPEGLAPSEHADPMNQQDDVERELSRLRLSTVDAIVREYLGTRDHLDEKRHEFQSIEKDLKSRMTMMSMVMREKADAIGVDAFPIRGLGTAYRAVKTSIRVADWDSYWKWLVETGNSQCVEKRAAKLAVLEVSKRTGAIPPGLEKLEEVEFLVRRND